MPQLDNGIRGKPRSGVGKRDGADFRRRDGIKTKKDAAVAPCAGGAALVVLLAVVILAVAKKRKSGKK